MIAAYGNRYFKLKLGGDLEADLARLRVSQPCSTAFRIVRSDARRQRAIRRCRGDHRDFWRDACRRRAARAPCRERVDVPRAAAAARRSARDSHIAPLARAQAVADRRIRRDARRVSARLAHSGYAASRARAARDSTSRCSTRARCAQWNAVPAAPKHFFPAEDLTTQAGLAVQQDLALAMPARTSRTSSATGTTTSNGFAGQGAGEAEQRALPRRASGPLRASDGGVRLAIRDGMIDLRSLDRAGLRRRAPSRTGCRWRRCRRRHRRVHGSPMHVNFIWRTTSGNPTTRHHHERRHRPHGHQPASDPLDLRDPRARRRHAGRRPPRHARSDPGRTQCRQARGAGARARRRRAGPPISTRRSPTENDTLYFDSASTGLRPQLIDAGDRRRQAHLQRKAGGADRGAGARALRVPRRRRSQARRRAGQALAAGPAEAQDARRLRLLRPHPVGARRVRLLGVRRRLAAGAAPVVELPQGRRRRHHRRHALPLALRARQSVRRGEERLVPRRDAHPEALGRERQALRGTADDAAYATFELGPTGR